MWRQLFLKKKIHIPPFLKVNKWSFSDGMYSAAKNYIAGADPGAGAPGARPSPKIGKNMIFLE